MMTFSGNENKSAWELTKDHTFWAFYTIRQEFEPPRIIECSIPIILPELDMKILSWNQECMATKQETQNKPRGIVRVHSHILNAVPHILSKVIA